MTLTVRQRRALVKLLRDISADLGAGFAAFDPKQDHFIEVNAKDASRYMDRIERWRKKLES